MNCSKCNEKAIYSNCVMLLCKNHFLSYFEAKVIRTINRYGLIKKNDIVCVATSGGKDSLAVLFMTMVYCRRNKIAHAIGYNHLKQNILMENRRWIEGRGSKQG